MNLSDKYLFNDYMISHGGRLEREDICDKVIKEILFDRPYSDLCDFLSETGKQTLLSRFSNNLFADFIFNPGANARAKKVSTNYFIGVNFGFVDTISLLTNLFLSNPLVLTDWFDSSEEDSSRWHDIHIEEFRLEDREIVSNNGIYIFNGYITPNSEERIMATHVITHLATLFAFLHELGHVIGGHLDLNKKVNNFDENYKSSYKIIFEFDADLFSLQMILFGSLLHTKNIFFPSFDKYDQLERKLSKTYLYTSLSIAVTLVLLLFSQQRTRMDVEKIKSHPNPLERLANIECYLLSQLNEPHWLLNDLFIKNWFSVSTDVYNSWIRLNLPNWHYLDVQNWELLRKNTLDRHKSNMVLLNKLQSTKEREVGIDVINQLEKSAKKDAFYN